MYLIRKALSNKLLALCSTWFVFVHVCNQELQLFETMKRTYNVTYKTYEQNLRTKTL